jgi:thimet oligopeptidase
MNKQWHISILTGLIVSLVTPAALAFADIPVPKVGKGAVVTTSAQNMDQAIADANAAIKAIIALPAHARNFDNTIGALDAVVANLENGTSMQMFMSNVHPDEAIREASTKAEEKYNNFMVDLWKREDLYKAVMEYANTKPSLQGEQKRLLEFVMRDYRRSGLTLPPEDRKKLAEVEKEIGALIIAFNKNTAEDESVVLLSKDELKGVPEDVLAGLPKNGDVYAVNMQAPTYLPVMENAELESTRQKTWMAHKRRAGKKNIAVLEKVLKLRAQQAALLGYENNADFEIEVRMAKEPQNVRDFYAKVRPLVREKARLDFEEFQSAKRQQSKNPEAALKPWDFAFFKNYLLKTKYAVDGTKVQQYFPMERVVEGLFSITQSLYGLEYKDVTATRGGTVDRPLWHPDVKLFEVYDKATKKMIGEFYLDMYPRENKYNHAAQWGLVQHRVWPDGKVTTPLAALVCNFTKPTSGAGGDKPSLLQHSEVETFFHEFGHCLHTIVSEAHYHRFSGTSVERDFVEAPSQMFENWVWDAQCLGTFARHYQTGEPLPPSLLEGMIAAKNLGSGLDAENQFYYGLTDLNYESTKDGVVDTTKMQADLYSETQLYNFRPDGTYYQASFGHLMHYNAGYYGYMWSLVYASDMFQRFKELGMLSPEAGKYYKDKIIARGGTKDGMDLVRDYLGREPNLDAFAKELGLKK